MRTSETIRAAYARNAERQAQADAARAMLAALERIVAQGYGLRNEAEAEKAIAQAKAAGISPDKAEG